MKPESATTIPLIDFVDSLGKGSWANTKRLSMLDRAKVASSLATLIGSNNNKSELSPFSKTLLRSIEDKGYALITDYLSPLKLSEIHTHFAECTGFNAHVPIYADGNRYTHGEDYDFSVLSYSASDALKCGSIRELICDREIIALAAEYLNCAPTFYALNCYRTYPGRNYSTHEEHRDYDDYKFLTCFMYLTDVGEDDGPLAYCEGSHKSLNPGPATKITGKAGTLVIADTYGIHHGTIPRVAPRFALWWRYGLSLNAAYWGDENHRYRVFPEEIFEDKMEEGLCRMMRGFLF